MAIYEVPGFASDIGRDAVLLDTNVLYAAFNPHDDLHESAKEFLDEWPVPFVVSMGVVVEAWGLLVRGKHRRLPMGLDLLQWLSGNPGVVSVLPQMSDSFSKAQDLVNSIRVDCMDALLSHLANDVSTRSFGTSDIRLATFDVSDFVRCKERHGLRVIIMDLTDNAYPEY